jgi:hypothetical protein
VACRIIPAPKVGVHRIRMDVQVSGSLVGREQAHEQPSVAVVGSGIDSECVLGPWRGFFVAAYVTEFAGAFYGYAKIYEHEPQSPWCADALVKVGSPGCPCPAEALDSASEPACGAVDDMLAGARQVLWRELALRTVRRLVSAATHLLP